MRKCTLLTFFRVWIALLFSLAIANAYAVSPTRVPDFYSEPGLNPFRDQVQANATGSIDPLSGNLSLSNVDLLVHVILWFVLLLSV